MNSLSHHSALFTDVPAVVAIPVRDEAERIIDCLAALARQDAGAPGVLLLVNNTTDATTAVVREWLAGVDMAVAVVEHRFGPEAANAGQARRLAMALADEAAPAGVPLLCTDADGRVEPDWLGANLRHLRAGCDAVFGQAVIDPVEARRIPPALHHADAQECAYGRLLDEIEHRIDPNPDDPWPRHTEHSGASIAVTRAAFRAVGGIPGVPLGEDRAFAQALRARDARIRHAPEVRVVVSGRILGRAAGGMADTIRRRLVAPDRMLDDALEGAVEREARIRLKRAARMAFVAAGRPGFFGAAWAVLDAGLPHQRVPVSDLPRQTDLAHGLLDALRTEIVVA